MQMPSWLIDPTYSGAAATVAGAIAAIFLLDRPRWDAKSSTRAREREALEPHIQNLYRSRPHAPQLYAYIPKLALRRNVPTRSVRLAMRASRFLSLSQADVAEGIVLAEVWANHVGEFAFQMQEEPYELRRFYQTNHLAVIRDGVVAMTILLAMSRTGRLPPGLRERALWGIALVEGAARYNSLAPQQRQAVFVSVDGFPHPFGPLVQAPPVRKRYRLWVQNLLGGGLFLRRRDFEEAAKTFVAAEALMRFFE